MQFLTNCGHHFASGRVITLNPRDQKRRISYEPGGYLDKGEKLLETNWDLAPGVLYNYCEGLLETLDSYSPVVFFSKDNLTKSMNDYKGLSRPNPLLSPRHKQIVAHLENPTVTRVFAGRHEPTKHNVTKPMVEDAIGRLTKLDNIFKNELKYIKQLRARNRKGSVIEITSAAFQAIPEDAIFRSPIVLQVIGRAAARQESWVLDSSEEVSSTTFGPYTAVFVLGNSLNPVIRNGQCALLATEDIQPDDDDLVAVVSGDGDRFLRKIWSDQECYILQAIHPTKPVPALRTDKAEAALRKVIGVLYDPPVKPLLQSSSRSLEWYPYTKFPARIISNLKTLTVEGDSLNPIARKGQKVLVGEPETVESTRLEDGGLAALEVNDRTIGNVIKRVYRKSDRWILVSPNPVQPYNPDCVPPEKIDRVWPLRGVLFESVDN